nr:tyrosine-type recombinase/integrase [Bradyrhizobium sp. 166]
MHAENPRHQVPAADALGHAVVKRRPPYIYSADEIARLLRAAAALRPVGSIRPTMYVTLFGLLTATGMRIAEALALQIDDVTADGLVVRQTKFQESPLLPLHATARLALDRYLVARRSLTTTDRALFVSVPDGRCPTTPCDASSCNSSIVPISGARTRARSAHPRSAPHLRGPLAGAVPPRSCCGRAPYRGAQHLPRPRPRDRHLLVLAGDADPNGPDRRGRRGIAHWRRRMTALAPT